MRRIDVVAMAHRQTEAAGHADTTDYLEGLIRADRRGPGIRLARAVGMIGATLSEVQDLAGRGDLPAEEFQAVADRVTSMLVILLQTRLVTDDTAGQGEPSQARSPNPPRRRQDEDAMGGSHKVAGVSTSQDAQGVAIQAAVGSDRAEGGGPA